MKRRGGIIYRPQNKLYLPCDRWKPRVVAAHQDPINFRQPPSPIPLNDWLYLHELMVFWPSCTLDDVYLLHNLTELQE